MNQEEIIDRLMKVTRSWETTFRLLDKYENTGELAPCEPPLKLEQPKPHAPTKAEIIEEKVVKYAPKKVRIKKGSIPTQIKEILEVYPDSSLPEIGKLGDWSFHDRKHMTSGLSRMLRQMTAEKIVVRKKQNGLYTYRLAEKK